jgi:tetratricopeptide (TPR) repeat protein
VKVLDFGLVKDLNEDDENGMQPGARERLGHRTRSDVMVGTPLYLSPEQATSGAVDGRSDLFALGAVLYECISGRSAFSGSSVIEIGAQVIHVDPPAPSSINVRVPAELDRITMKALAKKPEQRYQNAAEMIIDLQAVDATLELGDTRITRGSHPSVTNPSAVMKITETLRRPRLSVGIFVIALLVAGAAVWFVPRWLRAGLHKPSARAEVLFQTGTEALRAGAYQKAAKELEQSINEDSKFALAHARLAEALMEQDYADRALQELVQANQLVPDRSVLPKVQALYLEAINDIAVNNYSGAIQAYRQIVSENPDQAQSYLDLGRAYEKNEQIPEAINSFVQATNHDPNYAPAYLRAGILYQRDRQMATARQAYDKADSLFQEKGNIEGQTEVLLNRGALLRETDKFSEARTQLQRALELAEATKSELQRINALIELGRVAYNEGGTAQAETYLQQAIEFAEQSRLEPPMVRSLITLGYTKRVQLGSEELERNAGLALSIARRTKSPYLEGLALTNLATLRIRQLRVDEGLRYAEQALAIFQAGKYRNNITICLSLIGRARRRKGDYPGALQALEERLKLANDAGNLRQVASSYGDIAMVLFEQERYPEALKRNLESHQIYQSLNDRLNLSFNLMNRGNFLWRMGDYDQAEAVLKEAAQLATIEAYPSVLLEVELIRAQAALSRGRFADANVIAKGVLAKPGVQLEGLPIQANYTLGLSLALSGGRAEGLRLCNDAVALARQADDAALLSRALLALAEAQLKTGATADALKNAGEAEQRFSSAGQKASAWRALMVAARASKALRDEVNAQQYLERAASLLPHLQAQWGEPAFNLYFTRPDVQGPSPTIGRPDGRRE